MAKGTQGAHMQRRDVHYRTLLYTVFALVTKVRSDLPRGLDPRHAWHDIIHEDECVVVFLGHFARLNTVLRLVTRDSHDPGKRQIELGVKGGLKIVSSNAAVRGLSFGVCGSIGWS